MPRRRTALLRAAVVAALIVLPGVSVTACGRDLPPVPGTESVASADRAEPLALTGPTLDGGTLDLADYRGRIVVLNNWASWCAPCREETPALVDLATSSDPADVAVVGMNVTDEHDAAVAFAKEFAMPYPSIEDPEGRLLAQIPGVPPSSLPSTVVLDREGRVAARIIGGTDAIELGTMIARVMAEQPAA